MIAAAKKQVSLYEKVIMITADYLGPAARRFIDRQIENHLQKEPQQLTQKDLAVLVDWTKLAVALLTEDKRIIDELSGRLMDLGKNLKAGH